MSKLLHIVYVGNVHEDAHELTVDHHLSILQTVFPPSEVTSKTAVYHYVESFSGFAVMLTTEQADTIRNHPDVASVFVSKVHQLHTVYTWRYLGLDPTYGNVWQQANEGKGVIIGLIDSGIWPEHESFKDDKYGNIPAKWKGGCTSTANFSASLCNRKLIGAKAYSKGEEAAGIISGDDDHSPRDGTGHGSHTSSTAAGSLVWGASFFGIGDIPSSFAQGMAPAAHIAMYKACWNRLCTDADILAAFHDALADGVDVLSVSLGSSDPSLFNGEAIVIGSFHAFAKNIVVACSAGNDGPNPGVLSNGAPWILTVGASTVDREYATHVELGPEQSTGGSSFAGRGISPFTMAKRSYPLIDWGAGAAKNKDVWATYCLPGSLDPAKVKGAIVMCLRYDASGSVVSEYLKDVGVAGVIMLAEHDMGYSAVATYLPTSVVDVKDYYLKIAKYIDSTKNPTAVILKSSTEFGKRPAPQTASFSSVGPAVTNPAILKPDLTAPGVDIMAAWVPISIGGSTTDFYIDSGTSMSCPHAAGVAALIKAIHPTWSAAAIKSALMTTATPLDPTLENNKQQAFSSGAGQIAPQAAADPGLVYDSSIIDHVLLLCSLAQSNSALVKQITGDGYICPNHHGLPRQSDFNYPSIVVHNLVDSFQVTRTVTNVGPATSTYTVSVEPPPRVGVIVNPPTLSFSEEGEKQSFTVTFKAAGLPASYQGFGSLTWTGADGHRSVKSPVVVSNNPESV